MFADATLHSLLAFARATNVKFSGRSWAAIADSYLGLLLVVGIGVVLASVILSRLAARRTTFDPTKAN